MISSGELERIAGLLRTFESVMSRSVASEPDPQYVACMARLLEESLPALKSMILIHTAKKGLLLDAAEIILYGSDKHVCTALRNNQEAVLAIGHEYMQDAADSFEDKAVRLAVQLLELL